MVKKKKFTFILKNINPEEIDKKYGIEFKSNLQQDNKPIRNITKIDKLSINANKNFYSYLDESKKIIDVRLVCLIMLEKSYHKKQIYVVTGVKIVFQVYQ